MGNIGEEFGKQQDCYGIEVHSGGQAEAKRRNFGAIITGKDYYNGRSCALLKIELGLSQRFPSKVKMANPPYIPG